MRNNSHFLCLNMPNRLSISRGNDYDPQRIQLERRESRQGQSKSTDNRASPQGRPQKMEGEEVKKKHKRVMKRCPLCRESKRRDSGFYSDSSRTNGHCSAYCKACQLKRAKKYREKHRERIRAWLEKYHAMFPAVWKHAVLKNKYGITLDDFKKMVQSQRGRCAICGIRHKDMPKANTRFTRFHVDHCHATGKVRALLCGPCNKRLDHMATPELLRKSADYLEKHSTKTIN